MSILWKRTLLILVAAGSAVAVHCAYNIAERRVRASETKKEVNLWPTFALAICVLTALCVDENVIRLFPLPPWLSWLYRADYSFKWELMALVAAGVLTFHFWFEELRDKNKIDEQYFGRAMTSLLFVFISLVSAVSFLFGYSAMESDESDWKYVIFGLHFFFAWIVSGLFLILDYSLWKGLDSKHFRLKNSAELLYYLADWPIFSSFTLLGVYCAIHWAEHRFLPGVFSGLLASAPRATSRVHVNMWRSEVYFMSGAIAFQYLLSAGFYVALSWNFISLVDAQRKTVEAGLNQEEPQSNMGFIDISTQKLQD